MVPFFVYKAFPVFLTYNFSLSILWRNENMSRKRARKLPKPKIAPTPPTTYRRLYGKEPGGVIPGIVLGSFLLLITIAISSNIRFNESDALSGRIFLGGMMLLGVFLILAPIFGPLESVILNGENLIFSYRLTKKVYKASEVAAIGWQTGIYSRPSRHTIVLSGYRARFKGDLGPSGDLYGMYGRYTFLSVRLKNGKRLEIPGSPYSHFDIEKPLLTWLERYNPSEDENAESTE